MHVLAGKSEHIDVFATLSLVGVFRRRLFKHSFINTYITLFVVFCIAVDAIMVVNLV